jgi:hypothetical protein
MSRKRTYYDWDDSGYREPDIKSIMIPYFRPEDQPRVLYFSTEADALNTVQFGFIKKDSSWVLVNNGPNFVLGVKDNNDEIAMNILTELNNGEMEEATTLEIEPIDKIGRQQINFGGYTYTMPGPPIMKGGKKRKTRRNRKRRYKRNKRSRKY